MSIWDDLKFALWALKNLDIVVAALGCVALLFGILGGNPLGAGTTIYCIILIIGGVAVRVLRMRKRGQKEE